MKRTVPILATAILMAVACAAPAQAAFGLKDLGVSFLDENGDAVSQAGAHPFEMKVDLSVNTRFDPELEGTLPGGEIPDGEIRNLIVSQVEGLAGAPTATPRCSSLEFLAEKNSLCADSAAVGVAELVVSSPDLIEEVPVYNLEPPPGVAAQLGFWALGTVPVTIELGVAPDAPYNIVGGPTEISQVVPLFGSELTIWGVPGDPAHDTERGRCAGIGGPPCPTDVQNPEPFLTLPRACEGRLSTGFRALSWEGDTFSDSVTTPAFQGCERLGLTAEIDAQPTSESASSASGLNFNLHVDDPNITSSAEGAIAHSDIKRAKVTLPEGMTINPSQAEGLEVCSEGELDAETASSEFGDGCPPASKIGTVEVETPLLKDEVLHGSLFVAEPRANLADDSLIAFYIVIKDRDLGIVIKQPAKVEGDPDTGRLVTTTEDMPQLPFSDFRLHFREGGRSPLITPPGCGAYRTEAVFTPWANPDLGTPTSSTFEIESGVDGGSCPSGGEPPFEPGFMAGTVNNAAGAYSPFLMRLTRRDGEQDLTKFSAVLPPGVTARLAGLAWCPEASIARASGRDGEDELDSPSCPVTSKIGRVVAGAGVGSQLTYVDGSLYLAGPYKGAPLSVVAIVPAVAGPFDVGTVVTRVGLRLNPKTGQGEVDGAASDPIPHILEGIPLKVRDIRVLADRPAFTLNPTSCAPFNTFATIWGGGSNPFSVADDAPFGIASRFQAASCAALQFQPKLAIKLRGGVRRGAHPALRAIVTPPPGQANFSRAVVTLPRSAFLEQAHIRTICTRVQFVAPPGHGAHCPPGARYGFARAWSPLLDAPAQGPVYLRSSDNQLPDLVVALKGPASAPVDVARSARLDSVTGGIRSTFTGIPDLPVSRFILAMQGGKKGLIVNSRHLCHKPGRNRATSNLRGQNGRLSKTKPRVVATTCAKRRKAKRARAKRSTGHVARASALR